MEGIKHMNCKKNIIIFLSCLFYFGVLCGCHKTPQEVTDRTKDYGENNQIKLSDSDITYYSVKELKNNSVSNIDDELDNVELPDNIDFSGIEDIATIEMSSETKFLDENKQKYIELFGIDENRLTYDKNKIDGRFAMLDDEKKYFCICDSGFLSYNSGMKQDSEASPVKISRSYYLDSDDISNETLEFNGGEANISEMSDKAEKWLNENMRVDNLEYKISDAYVIDVRYKGELKHQLLFAAEHEYKGIRFNSYGSIVDNKSDELLQTVFNSEGPYIEYDDKDVLSWYTNLASMIKFESSESVERIIDFKSAVKIVNATLAGFNKLQFDKVVPLYIVVNKDYIDDKKEYGNKDIFAEARPAYAFMVLKNDSEVKAEQKNPDSGYIKSNIYEYLFFVDMITGDYYTNIGFK